MPELRLVRFRQLLRGHFRSHWPALTMAATAMLGFACAELLAPWPVKLLVDNVLLHKPAPHFLAPLFAGGAEMAVILLAALALGVSLVKGSLSYTQVFVTSRVGFELVHTLRTALFAHLQRLTLSFHHRARAGELLTKVTQDTAVLKDAFSSSLLEVLAHGTTLVGMCVVLAFLNWRLALVLLVTLPLMALTVFTIYRRGKNAARRQRESEGHVAARIGEMLHLTALVRAFAREHAEERRFLSESAQSVAQSIRTVRTEAATSRAVEMVSAAGVSGTLLCGGLLAVRGEISPGELLVFLTYLANMYKPLRNLAKISGQLAKAQASAERIEEILRLAPDPGLATGRPVQQLHGEFEFRSVSFAYEGGRPVLQNLSFRIAAGERVALVGSSGAGKSTIASLLLRLQTPISGAIYADGQPIRELDSASYRRQFGVVLQDALLLGASIADNIAYGQPEASPEAIEQAARQASAHEFICSLPDGYQTVIGERGSTLSGGQRQRLCLARALLTKPAVLILDEPTSAVDAESSALIHAALATEGEHRTTIVIAHQFHDMESFDRIFVLQQGELVEEGTHAQLLRRGGLYTQLVDAQSIAPALEETTR